MRTTTMIMTLHSACQLISPILYSRLMNLSLRCSICSWFTVCFISTFSSSSRIQKRLVLKSWQSEYQISRTGYLSATLPSLSLAFGAAFIYKCTRSLKTPFDHGKTPFLWFSLCLIMCASWLLAWYSSRFGFSLIELSRIRSKECRCAKDAFPTLYR